MNRGRFVFWFLLIALLAFILSPCFAAEFRPIRYDDCGSPGRQPNVLSSQFWTFPENVMDAPEDARKLVRLLSGIPSKVNLIPMNTHVDSDLRPPPSGVVSRFMEELVRGGITTTLRRSRGADIDAACGQLASRGPRPAPDQAAGAARR